VLIVPIKLRGIIGRNTLNGRAWYLKKYEIMPFDRQDQQALTTRCKEAV